MFYIILGNIIALIASLIMVYTGLIKSRKKIIYVQTIQILLFAFSCFILGGYSGMIVNIVCAIRNILSYRNKLGLKEKIILSIIGGFISIYFNNLGFIGLLPVIGTTVYIWFINVKDVVKFKILNTFTITLWAIYDFNILSYTSVFFDSMTIIANIYSIKLIKDNEKRKKKKTIFNLLDY